jgi:LL-diaminopimelate aminotransferase
MKFHSNRLKKIPPYVFATINQRKNELKENGIDVIDLGIGTPDLPTPPDIVNQLVMEVTNHQDFYYSPFNGIRTFREAVAHFYEEHYGVKLNPEEEILTLIGSKEGIAHIIPALADEEDTILVPDPGYPVYKTAAKLANTNVFEMALLEENEFLPKYSNIPKHVLNQAVLMFLNYPNNPTSATASVDFFRETVSFAKSHQIPVIHDAAYQLMSFDQRPAPSILQVDGALENCLEFGSLSKSFCMTGWRIGYAVGNKDLIKALATVKSNTDTSQFIPIQKAGAFALKKDFHDVQQYNRIFEERVNYVYHSLKALGIEAVHPKATFYIWAKVPDGFDSSSFSLQLLEKCGVVVTPGSAFGKYGRGYFRISCTLPVERLQEAIDRISKFIK